MVPPAPVIGPASVLNNNISVAAQAQAQSGRPVFSGIGLAKKRGRPPGATDSKPRKKQNKNTGVRVGPMNNFFGARAVTAPLAAAAATAAAVAVAVGEGVVAADNYDNEEVAAAAADEDDEVVVGTNMLHSEAGEGRREYTPNNVVAELDVDDDQIDNAEAPEGVMAEYLEKIQKRLRFERANKLATTDKWLLYLLDKGPGSDWWLRSGLAKHVCKKLDIEYGEPSYYKDLYVWLPDERWGPMAMPPCPTCKSCAQVSPHDFQSSHFARRVCDLDDVYYIMTQRYICYECKGSAIRAGRTVVNEATMSAEPVEETQSKYTFMGYDPDSRIELPWGYGDEYPAFHMHKSAISIRLIDWMLPSFNASVRPGKLSKMICEMHTVKYTREYIKREHRLERDAGLKSMFVCDPPPMFSSYGDKSGYGGSCPTGNYLSCAYKSYMSEVKPYYDKCMQMLGADRISIDASYKEASKLGQYHGEPIFNALITVTNQNGEIRKQFHTVTDAHDQIKGPITEMLATMKAYGHPMPEVLITDKPASDKSFYYSTIPSLKETKIKLESAARLNNPTASSPLSECDFMPYADNVIICKTTHDIQMKCAAVRELMNDRPQKWRVICMDAEWNVSMSARGFIGDIGTVALIQLSYAIDESIHVLLLQVHGKQNLPERLLALLADPNISFVGRQIGGDISKIRRDFRNAKALQVKTIDLGTMAHARGAVPSSRFGLEHLVKVVLSEQLDKTTDVRVSDKWSSPELSPEQVKYSALDVIKGLEVYFKLDTMIDLSARLVSEEAIEGRVVDILPSNGSTQLMTASAATARIVTGDTWITPSGCTPQILRKTPKRHMVMVEVMDLYASALKVPYLTRRGEQVIFGDLGQTPFRVMLPLRMLKPHVESKQTATIASQDYLADNNVLESGGGRHNASDIVEQSDGRQNTSNNFEQRDHAGYFDDTIWGLSDDFDNDNNGDDIGIGRHIDCDDWSFDDVPNDNNEDAIIITSEEIATVRAAMAVGADLPVSSRRTFKSIDLDKKLGVPPNIIVDSISTVIGDGFHYTDRIKTPVHHTYKKGYYVALREAIFAWDPVKLAEVKASLRSDGIDDAAIEAMMYYNVDYFRQRVPRIILSPSKLYWRVRGVLELYGMMVDPKTGKTLFNDNAWKIAKNLLMEILDGNVSDPPGMSFYSHRLTAKGELAYDSNGHALLNCSRGTNATECVHKQIVATFGHWRTGVEFADYLLADFCHRYNQHVSEKHRTGFPVFGHPRYWLINTLQKLVLRNHGVHLYPEFPNMSEYGSTQERNGTIPLHSLELGAAVDNIVLPLAPPGKPYKLSPDEKYLCKMTKTKLPFVPVVRKEEKMLFNRMLLGMEGTPDFDKMAIDWCMHVDGVNIFPKLPVYLRRHYSNYLHSQQVRDAVANAAPGEVKLRQLNEQFGVEALLRERNTTVDANPTLYLMPTVTLPPTISQIPDTQLLPEGRVAVAGTIIGGAQSTRGAENHPIGKRGKDKSWKIRAPRRCKYCVQHGKSDEEAAKCPGSQPVGICTGGLLGASLQCLSCGSSIRCKCKMPHK